MAYKGPVNRLFIDTALTTYTLTNEEIKDDPIIFFNSTSERTVTLNFPVAFDAGHTVEAYQGFDQGLGDIIIDAPFQSPVLGTFRKPDFVSLITLLNSKVRIMGVERTIAAFAIVSPLLFIDGTAAEITSYRSRYRMRIFNTGTNALEVGLDDIPIETGWTGVSRYTLEISEEKYIPKGSDAFLLQTIGWSSAGGQAPEGGEIVFDWTKISDDSKTVDITGNENGSITFTLFKRPLLTFI